MIFGYFDESGGEESGQFVIAGFVGRKKSWKSFVEKWSLVTGGRPIHLNSMRLGSANATRRWGQLLRELAKIPPELGLKPFVGSVKTSDYAVSIQGTIAELALKGYHVALAALIEAVLDSDLPKRDRIEFIFERQLEFALAREWTFEQWISDPRYMAHHKTSRIAKHSSQNRSVMLEASDYLCYAVLQQLIDPSSQKAALTAPILEGYERIPHRVVPKEMTELLIRSFLKKTGRSTISPLQRENKAFIQNAMREKLASRSKRR